MHLRAALRHVDKMVAMTNNWSTTRRTQVIMSLMNARGPDSKERIRTRQCCLLFFRGKATSRLETRQETQADRRNGALPKFNVWGTASLSKNRSCWAWPGARRWLLGPAEGCREDNAAAVLSRLKVSSFIVRADISSTILLFSRNNSKTRIRRQLYCMHVSKEQNIRPGTSVHTRLLHLYVYFIFLAVISFQFLYMITKTHHFFGGLHEIKQQLREVKREIVEKRAIG